MDKKSNGANVLKPKSALTENWRIITSEQVSKHHSVLKAFTRVVEKQQKNSKKVTPSTT